MTETDPISPSIGGLTAFPLTPATSDGVVLVDEVTGLVDRLASTAVSAIGVLGSTGIQAYLTRQERRRAIVAAAEANGGRKPLMVGIGAMRTDDACVLASDAAEAGADWLVLTPISYTPLTQEEAFAHYQMVAAETELPLCIYANPGTTHFVFSRDLIRRLAQEPSIKAIKMPLTDDGDVAGELAVLRAACPADFSLGYSADWEMVRSFAEGADCFHSAAAGLFPNAWLALAEAARTDNQSALSAFRPMLELLRAHGSLRVLYACAAQMGLTKAVPPRPILPLDADVQKQCAVAMARFESFG
ncbi:MAG: dihydrodipicolinate synthase family protein [Pseudomonadota bacterium]